MSNDIRHEMLATMVQFMLYIYRVHYGLILTNVSVNFVSVVYHTIMFSGEDFKYSLLHKSDVQC